MHRNPYRSALPVTTPDQFFGRQKEIQQIVENLHSSPPISMSIVGRTRIGKTSLLHIISCLNDSTYVRELAKYSVEPQQFAGFAFVYLDLWQLMIKPYDSLLAFFQQICSAINPQSNHRLLETLSNKARLEVWMRMETEFKKILATFAKHNRVLVLLVDEVDAESLSVEIASYLRSLLQDYRENLVYITSSRQELYKLHEKQRDGGTEKRSPSPLYNYLDSRRTYLGLLTPESAVNYIRIPAARSGVEFTSDDVDFTMVNGGGHPDLTRLICSLLFERRGKAGSKMSIDYSKVYAEVSDMALPLWETLWNDSSDDEQQALALAVLRERRLLSSSPSFKSLVNIGLVNAQTSEIFSPLFADYVRHRVNTSETFPSRSTVEIYKEQRIVKIGDKVTYLSPLEFQVFELLYFHPGEPFAKERIMHHIGETSSEGRSTDAVAMLIARLRKKIEDDPSDPELIVTVRGHGYMWGELGATQVTANR